MILSIELENYIVSELLYHVVNDIIISGKLYAREILYDMESLEQTVLYICY